MLPAIEGKEILFYERGDDSFLPVHPDFRLIGCMNPGGEIGKKELPLNIRCRFTQLHLQEMTSRSDLVEFVKGLLGASEFVPRIASVYQRLRAEVAHFSLRNLSRGINYLRQAKVSPRGLFDAMSLGFGHYSKLMEEELGVKPQIPALSNMQFKVEAQQVSLYGFSLPLGKALPIAPSETDYIITEGNFPYLLQCLRCVQQPGLPVLLEGPTSGGKTSLVYFLAKISG